MAVLEITTLFFDAGGTLLHPKESIGRTYSEIGRTYGADFNPIDLERDFRGAFRKLKSRPVGTIPRNGDDRAWWKEVVRETLSGSVVPANFRFDEYFESLYVAYADPLRWGVYPEVEEILEWLHQRGFRMAVVSNWDSRLRPLLGEHFLTPLFNEIFISGELGTAKPDPSLYERALNGMQCSPHEALMIGDDPVNDVQVPKSLGWDALLVDRPRLNLRFLLDYLMA